MGCASTGDNIKRHVNDSSDNSTGNKVLFLANNSIDQEINVFVIDNKIAVFNTPAVTFNV